MGLSIGFRSLISLLPAIQATGRLAVALAGLPPAEHASLRWTHETVRRFPRRGGRVCASTGPAASTASSGATIGGVTAWAWPNRASLRSSAGTIVDPEAACAVILSRGGLRSAGDDFSPPLGLLGPKAGHIEFQQHRVMHQAIDRRGRRHLIPKD